MCKPPWSIINTNPTHTMTILQLLADMAHAVEMGDIWEFTQLQDQANQMLLTSTEFQQVTTIVATLEQALENR